MTPAVFIGIALIHLAAAISPGPSFAVAVRTAAAEGMVPAAGAALGFGLGAVALSTVLGLLLIQLMRNGLALAGAKGDATTIVVGLVLIGAVLINTFITNPPERVKRLLPSRS